MENARDRETDPQSILLRLRSVANRRPTTELIKLRERINAERKRTHQGVIERVAREANISLEAIYEEVRPKNKAKQRYVAAALKRIEAVTSQEALRLCKRVEQSRARYLNDFGKILEARRDKQEIWMRTPLNAGCSSSPAECHSVLGSLCGGEDLGAYEASANAEFTGDKASFHPYIYTRGGDCDTADWDWATVLQEALFQQGAPDAAFHVTGVRVDLWGVGYAMAHLGDGGFWDDPNPAYAHSLIEYSLILYQEDPELEFPIGVPLIENMPLFHGKGDYALPVTVSAGFFACDHYIKSKAAGGGNLYVYLALNTRSLALGSSGAEMKINFSAPDYYIDLSGVSLVGEFI